MYVSKLLFKLLLWLANTMIGFEGSGQSPRAVVLCVVMMKILTFDERMDVTLAVLWMISKID